MPARPLSKSCAIAPPRLESVFAGELFAMHDWRCDGHDAAGRREEWNDAARVVVTRRGAFRLHWDGDDHIADQTTATFWNANEPYRVTHPVAGGDECTVFRLTDRGARELVALADPRAADVERPRFPRIAQRIDGRSYLMHRIALQHARDGRDGALAVEEPALTFLRSVMAPARVEPTNRQAAEYAQRAQEVIARDYRQPLSLSSLARAVHCSPFHLSRLYRGATGLSLHRAMVRLRLREGLERLLGGGESLSSIALDVGFSSHSHFTDAFRREFGRTPQAIRRG